LCNELSDRRTNPDIEISRLPDTSTCDRYHTRDQGLSLQQRTPDCGGGSDIMANDTQVNWQALAGDFLSDQCIDELFLAAGRVNRWNGDYPDIRVTRFVESVLQAGDSIRHTVFDTDHHLPGVQGVTHNAYAIDDLLRPAAHQRFVTADVGFAFGRIDDQQFNLLVRARVELYRSRKAGAAQADDTRIADALPNISRIGLKYIFHPQAAWRSPVFTICLDDDAVRFQPGGVRDRIGADIDNPAGGRGMHGCADITQ